MNTNLNDFFKKIKNPLENDDTLNNLIELYSNRGLSFNDYYHGLFQLYSKNKHFYNPKEYDKLYVDAFNTWRKYVLSISEQKKEQLIKDGKIDSDFSTLQKFLKALPPVKTKKEADMVLSVEDEKLEKAMKKYRYTSIDNNDFSWNRFCSNNISAFQNTYSNTEHSLYVGINSEGLHKFARILLKKCEEKNLPYYFKVSSKLNRDDSLIVYSDTEHLLDYCNILEEIYNENDDLKNYAHKSPIVAGNINDWLGYGTEPKEQYRTFKEKRVKVIYEAINKEYTDFLFDNPDINIYDELSEIPLLEEISWRIAGDKLKYLEGLQKKDLKSYFGIVPRDLRGKKLSRNMRAEIEEVMGQALRDKTTDFEPIKFQYRTRGKNKNKYLEISRDDMNRALISVLPDVIKRYPNLKDKIKNRIQDIAKKEGINPDNFSIDTYILSKLTKVTKDEPIKTNTNSLHNTDDKNNSGTNKEQFENNETERVKAPLNVSTDKFFDAFSSNTTYRLKKEQIIQDLPIYSKAPSRFKGIMTDDEIKESQEKIKTFVKK